MPVGLRIVFFLDAMLISVVCFPGGHPKLYFDDFGKLNVDCRKLRRCMVAPPAAVIWNGPWHEILHFACVANPHGT